MFRYLDEIKYAIRNLSTPGHTNDSYCFLVDSIKPGILFTGDTLLIRGTGRTDFQNGDPSELYDSITNKIFILYDDTEIYPGDYVIEIAHNIINENKKLDFSSFNKISDLLTKLSVEQSLKLVKINLNIEEIKDD